MDIAIRMAEKKDAKKLLNIYKYYIEETNITFEYTVPSEIEFSKRIENILKKYPYIVAEINNKIIGYAYANTFNERAAYGWTVEWSIYLDNSIQGKGIGQKLYNKLVEILKLQNIVTIEACITYPNEKSVIFHEKNNFKKVAHFNKVGYKFNKWHDVVWYEKNISEHLGNIKPIKYIDEIEIKF